MQRGLQPHLADGRSISGPGASALKYDILTALLTLAAHGTPADARLSLRLSLLITARFNWRRGTFAVGLREMARLWGVTERTAKREVAAMRARGWLSVAIPAARGRVACHHVDIAAVLGDTMPYWPAVGPDFAARMTGAPEPAPSNVVALRPLPASLPADDTTGWSAAASTLRQQDACVFDAWFSALVPIEVLSGVLYLEAPTGFVATYVTTHFKPRLLAATVAANPDIRNIVVRTVSR